jgi:hypothetical protein
MNAMQAPMSRRAERRFHRYFILVLIAAVLLGFSRTYYLRPLFPEWVELHAPPEPFYLFHGALMTAWFVVLIMQSSFISAGRVDLHRRLGALSMGLAAAIFVFGIAATVIAARRPIGFIDVDLDPRSFMLGLLVNFVLYGAFVALAYARRRDAQVHKRLMLLATVSIVSAAIIRWPFELVAATSPVLDIPVADLIAAAFLLPMVVWDLRSIGRIHPVTALGGLVLIAYGPLVALVWQSPAWLAIAGWIVGA